MILGGYLKGENAYLNARLVWRKYILEGYLKAKNTDLNTGPSIQT